MHEDREIAGESKQEGRSDKRVTESRHGKVKHYIVHIPSRENTKTATKRYA
jgi:hypothetical protein